MFPFTSTHSRSRRSLLRSSALTAVVAAIAQACGEGKTEQAAISPSGGTAAPASVGAATAPPAAEPEASAASTAPVDSAVTAPGTSAPSEAPTPPAGPVGATFGERAEMVVSFNYVPSDGGRRIHNPYIAVWLSDAAGKPVRTLTVIILQGKKGLKWLGDLKRWATSDDARQAAGGADIMPVVSSPTRLPGVTELVWDGKDDAGNLVPAGAYTLNIEAAREKGPYDMISQELAFTGDPFEQQLDNSGDLQDVRVVVRAR